MKKKTQKTKNKLHKIQNFLQAEGSGNGEVILGKKQTIATKTVAHHKVTFLLQTRAVCQACYLTGALVMIEQFLIDWLQFPFLRSQNCNYVLNFGDLGFSISDSILGLLFYFLTMENPV